MPKELQMSGIIGEELNAQYVRNLLDGLQDESINVQLYTPGGYVYEGMEIYNIISRYSGKKEVVLGGIVASIGSIVAMAFDKIRVTKASAFMIHNAWDFIVGDADELRKKAEKLEKLNNQIAGILSDKSKKTIDEIKSMMTEETWLFGQEIVDAGFADELVEAKDSGAQNIDKTIALDIAKSKFKNTIAALYVKTKPEFDSGNGVKNIQNGEESMPTKKEMLDKLVVMKESGELALSEITDSFKLNDMLVTKDHASALKIVNALKEMKIDDPVKYVQTMQEQLKADAESVRNAKLSEVFGVSVPDKDGNETNLVLAYAKNQVKDSAGDELAAAIETLKKDPIAVRLQAEKADPHSQANNLGIIDGKSNGKPAETGVETVVL